jgi:hypothetical protein
MFKAKNFLKLCADLSTSLRAIHSLSLCSLGVCFIDGKLDALTTEVPCLVEPGTKSET